MAPERLHKEFQSLVDINLDIKEIMATIPSYNRQVNERVANVPSLPSVDRSGNLRAINQNAEANQQIAQTGMKISQMIQKHAEEKRVLKNEQHLAGLETAYRSEIDNWLYDPGTETVNINGQDIERPKGMNRLLSYADGLTNDFDKFGAPTLDKYLNQVKDPVSRSKLAASLGEYSRTKRDEVLKHESKQSRDDLVNTFDSNIARKVADAYGIKDPLALNAAIEDATRVQALSNRAQAIDPVTSQLNQEKTAANVVKKAINGVITSPNGLAQGQILLEGAKDLITPESYDDIQKSMEEINKRVVEERAKVYEGALNLNEKDMLMKHGSIDISEDSLNNPVRGDFYKKYVKSLYAPPADTTNPESYNAVKMSQLNGVKDKEINNLVLDNIENLTIQDKEKLLQSKYDLSDSKTITFKATAQALHDWSTSTIDSLVLKEKASDEILYNFFQRVEKEPNANIDLIATEVQKDYIKKHYPSVTLLPDVPNLIGNRNKIRKIYQKESKAGGKKVAVKPVSAVYQKTDIDFNDL